MPLEDEVAREVRMLREVAGQARPEGLTDGSWLLPVARQVLAEYAHTDLEVLSAAHPGITGEALVDARIGEAQRRALLAGGLSAGVYASVVAGSLVTGGLFSVAALPTAIASFVVDLYVTARIQIRLGWDLAVLHGHAVDPTDEDQLLDLARLSYGVDFEGLGGSVVEGFLPVAWRFGARTATLGSRAVTAGAMQLLGRELVQRGLVRYAVPAIGVPLCAGVNWATTGRIAGNARRILRGHRQARADAVALADDLAATPTLLLEALLWIAGADERLAGVEVRLVEELAVLLRDQRGLPDADLAARDEEVWLSDLGRAGPDVRAEVYEAALRAAALDGVLHTEEDARLRRLAVVCGVPFDPAAVSRAIVAVRGS